MQNDLFIFSSGLQYRGPVPEINNSIRIVLNQWVQGDDRRDFQEIEQTKTTITARLEWHHDDSRASSDLSESLGNEIAFVTVDH